MIDLTGNGVADVGRSATFYDAALGALGMRQGGRCLMTWGPTASATVSTSCLLDRSLPPTLRQTSYRLCSQN